MLEVWTKDFMPRTLLVLVEAKWRLGKREDSKDKFFLKAYSLSKAGEEYFEVLEDLEPFPPIAIIHTNRTHQYAYN